MNDNIIDPIAEDKFTDQFFASTEGRNDIRRQQIEAYTTNKIIEELEFQRRYFSKFPFEEFINKYADDRIKALALNHRKER